MNKNGMTLIELLVYIAIAALLLAPVIMLMQNSSLNMARSAVNTDLRMSGRDILNIMYEDIRNTGFKLRDATGAVDSNVTYKSIESTPATTPKTYDVSSFRTGNSNNTVYYDRLRIRKGRLVDGGWTGYDTLVYSVIAADGGLARVNVFIPAGGGAPVRDSTILARGVEALQFQYSDSLLLNWEDDFLATAAGLSKKREVKYVKITLVLKDPKQLSPLRTAPPVEVVDGVTITPQPGDQALRERHEIVVPIPNNGLFPP